MKYYIISGEASGDLHASNLMKGLKLYDRESDFRCWGGDLMEAEGGEIVKHYRDLAFMGFVEVLMNIRTIMRNMSFCKKDILEYRPDVLILVDYPGFNLRIAFRLFMFFLNFLLGHHYVFFKSFLLVYKVDYCNQYINATNFINHFKADGNHKNSYICKGPFDKAYSLVGFVLEDPVYYGAEDTDFGQSL